MLRTVDVAVIGGGMAGAAVAYELATSASVVLLEREATCGYHSTGRSAASFTENYGPPTVRRLVLANRHYLTAPPDGFADHPLLSPRGMLTVARIDQMEALDAELKRAHEFCPTMHQISLDQAVAMVPALRREYLGGAILEPGSKDIDVHGLHQGFLRGFRTRGGRIVTEAEVGDLSREGGTWRLSTRAGEFSCQIVVNAAGAWADRIGAIAGAVSIGLVPKRRTAFHISAPESASIHGWPLVNDVGGEFYFKPNGGRLLVSPADQTPCEPCDVQAEEMDVAVGAERLETATTIQVRRIAHRWAGLRSFVADGAPVVGFDPLADGFFWLAGQGGYGIKIAWALARSAAALIQAGDLPEDQLRLGLLPEHLGPNRLCDNVRANRPISASA